MRPRTVQCYSSTDTWWNYVHRLRSRAASSNYPSQTITLYRSSDIRFVTASINRADCEETKCILKMLEVSLLDTICHVLGWHWFVMQFVISDLPNDGALFWSQIDGRICVGLWPWNSPIFEPPTIWTKIFQKDVFLFDLGYFCHSNMSVVNFLLNHIFNCFHRC